MQKVTRSLGVLAALVAMIAVIACAPTGAPPAVQPTAATQATAAPVQATTAPAATQAPAATEVPAATQAPAGGAADTIVWLSNITDVISFDPAEAYEFGGILGVHSIYDTLVKFEGSDLTTLKPGLADTWDVKDAGDHWEITFHLKDGVKFASGNPFTADDVVFSLQRIITLKKPPSFLMTDIGKLTTESIKATDAKTVVLTMPKDVSPNAFLTVLTGPTGGIVDSKEAKAHDVGGDLGNTWLKDHSAGSGPYVLDHWTPQVEFLLKANPNAAIKPKTAQILVKHVLDPSVQQSLLEKGDTDIANDLTPEQITAVKGNSDITTIKAGNLQVFYVGMNVNLKPLDNPKVREALRYAIDYDGIVNDLLSGNAQKLQTIIPIGLFGANPDEIFKRDLDKAKSLLKEAGVENGFDVELQTYTGNSGIVSMGDLAAKLQADWAEIGVNAKVTQVDQTTLLTAYRAQKAPIVVLLWGPDFPDPDANGTPFSGAPLGKRNNFDDPKARELASKAALETDNTKRAADYKELTEYMAHNGPFAILFQPIKLYAMRSNLKGFDWNPIGYVDLWNLSK